MANILNILRVVDNEPKYYEFIRLLRNDERVKQGFIQQLDITKEQQEVYMQKHAHEYWVCLCDENPCGYVGVIDGDIRVATSPDYQKLGVGVFMINFLQEKFHKDEIYAKVKIDNEASKKLFEKAGYKAKYYIYTLE